jgi:CubicO group peptidase (beta-lactamase class C family)
MDAAATGGGSRPAPSAHEAEAPATDALARAVEAAAAASGFSGTVRVDRRGAPPFERAFGMVDRAHGVPARPATRFGIASATKGLTALVVAALVERGVLRLDTRARELLGDDLPLIDDAVTVEQLLAHRSGIGDYVDEDAMESELDHVLPVPVHRLAETEDYLAVLGGFRQVFPPGSRFAYNNGGFVVLALLAERAAGMPFRALVAEGVCGPAGMTATSFPRADEPAADIAVGYLDADSPRTNLLHLPVRGSGDGGAVSTAADIRALWTALFAGRIVPRARVADMVRSRSTAGEPGYGLGFWLDPGDVVSLVGSDAGVSFSSAHDPAQDLTRTVIANVTNGAWALTEAIEGALAA